MRIALLLFCEIMRRLSSLRPFRVFATTARSYGRNRPDAAVLAEERQALEDAVASYLTKASDDGFVPRLKDGNVFAALDAHQLQLNDMQRYVNETSRSPNSDIVPPLYRGVRLQMSATVQRDVSRHVRDREIVCPLWTSLLCIGGSLGSGKTTRLHHTTVEAVRVLEEMVAECVEGDAKRRLYRPLGFFVTFSEPADNSSSLSETRPFPVLTEIALRMAFAVLDDARRTDKPRAKFGTYKHFRSTILQHCDYYKDTQNFECIIAALRTVLHWKGSMFIAIDDFNEPRLCPIKTADEFLGVRAVPEALENVCVRLLDNALPVMSGKKHALYESYIAASVLQAADIAALSKHPNRPLIFQQATMLSVKAAAKLLTTEPNVFSTQHQIMFLVHVALCTFTPGLLGECMSQPRTGRLFCEGYFDEMFWNAKGHQVLPPNVATLGACLCAGMVITNRKNSSILGVHIKERDVFSKAPELADSCIEVDNLTLGLPEDSYHYYAKSVVVSPKFLRCLDSSWPQGRGSSTRTCVRAFASTLERHTRLATALVQVGSKLIAYGSVPRSNKRHEHVCGQLIDRWKDSTMDAFEQLTFCALWLQMSIVLEVGSPNVTQILGRVSSGLAWGDRKRVGAGVKLGPLESIAARNFPSFFADAFSLCDSQQKNDDLLCSNMLKALDALKDDDDLRAAVADLTAMNPQPLPLRTGDTSYERIQEALGKGNHFCFQSSNSNKNGEAGVVFLRNEVGERVWTVLVLQSLRGWMGPAGQLPATMVDGAGSVHTLRYVRILVAASRDEVCL
ncbi:multi-copy leucine-rich repeat protein, putative [Bodo saltans]|uniref:Multi-copy leucine-rich repeat protein, putative n=1 Tax=Bodo saltans TaxID=75058 RepID=A0A0S4IXI2_BODSA|nr:multi-copy leucine-rich repeat protein, putative [Bodo saltans]|eukprot:CUG40638.1 multi-copy leucine-rich repeat protein, putative [Bodo saltans]